MPAQTWYNQHALRFEAMGDLVPAECETLLDVGAAPYPLVEYLPDGIELYAINLGDPNEEQTKKKDGREIVVRGCNVETDVWPFQDDEMDVVVMGAIIEHLFDPLPALEEARRVLSEDGTLVLSTPNATRLIKRVNMLFGGNPFDGFAENNYHRHNHEWTMAELEDILPVAGFEISTQKHVALNRPGKRRPIQYLTSLHDGWTDQLVISATPRAEAADRQPLVYRESLVERESKSKSQSKSDKVPLQATDTRGETDR